MSIAGIQGQVLAVTVVGCTKLNNTEWISRQDPYVCLEYGTTKYRTRTCTDGGRNPTFQEKHNFTLIEGFHDIHVHVWNSNTLTADYYIGSGRVLLKKALQDGYDDSSWPLYSQNRKSAGEIRLILHYQNANANNHTNIQSVYQPPPVPMLDYPPALYPAQSTVAYHPAPYPPTMYPPPTYPPAPYPGQFSGAYPPY